MSRTRQAFREAIWGLLLLYSGMLILAMLYALYLGGSFLDRLFYVSGWVLGVLEFTFVIIHPPSKLAPTA